MVFFQAVATLSGALWDTAGVFSFRQLDAKECREEIVVASSMVYADHTGMTWESVLHTLKPFGSLQW